MSHFTKKIPLPHCIAGELQGNLKGTKRETNNGSIQTDPNSWKEVVLPGSVLEVSFTW